MLCYLHLSNKEDGLLIMLHSRKHLAFALKNGGVRSLAGNFLKTSTSLFVSSLLRFGSSETANKWLSLPEVNKLSSCLYTCICKTLIHYYNVFKL